MAPTLSYRASSRSWQLLGVAPEGGLIRATARAGDHQVDTMRWAHSTDHAQWPQVITTSGANAVIVETRYPALGDSRLWMVFSLLHGLRFESRLSRVDPSGSQELGRSHFMTACEVTSSDDRLLCSVFDGTRSRFAAVDPATSSITPLAWLWGRFAAESTSHDGWMSGWLGSDPVAIHPARREGIRVGSVLSATARVDRCCISTGRGKSSELRTDRKPSDEERTSIGPH
jgi:hypothetical protein